MEISLLLIAIFVAIVLLLCALLLLNHWSRNLVKRKHGETIKANTNLTGIDAEDAWEGSFSDAQNPLELNVDILIDYVDGAGLESSRVLKVRAFDNELHGGILVAHCQTTDALRTFRFNRIQSCKEVTSGDEIKDISVYLNQLYQRSIS